MIDNDIAFLQIYQTIASETPYKHYFQALRNPVDALKWIEERIRTVQSMPRYILLDLPKDNMSGLDFLKNFEQRTSYVDTCTEVVLMSNSLYDEQIHQALQYDSVSALLSKPLLTNQFTDFLASATIDLDAKRISQVYQRKR